jgi:O-antigen/teichoic acid export membrane protein
MVNLRRKKAAFSGSDTTALTAPIAQKTPVSVSRVVSLTVVDQGASSVSNFGLSVLVAHGSGAREIGVFALIYTTYVLGQGLVRSVTSDCLLTRSGAVEEMRVRYERAGYLFAFVAASALSLVLLAIAAIVGNAFAIPFVIFAACFPFMALQDFSRYIGISRHDPAYSIRIDLAWIAIFVVAVIGLRSAGLLHSLPWLIGAWTGAGALVGLSTVPTFLSLSQGVQTLRFWIASEWSVATRFAGQFMVGNFGAYGILYILVAVLTIDAIGLIKVTQLALAPMVVLYVGVQSALVSIVSRKMRENRRAATRFLNYAALLMTATMAIWTLAIYVAPAKDIAAVFGPTWVRARPFMLWVGFSTAVSNVSGAYLIGLRSMRSAKELLRLVIIMTPLLVVAPLAGGKFAGIRGAAVGLGVFYGIYAVIAWRMFTRTARTFEASEPDDGDLPASLADNLTSQGDAGPISLSDVLAREGLVAPISFAEMFARHGAVGPAHRVEAPVGENGVAPVSLAEMSARPEAVGPAHRVEAPVVENGVVPISFAEMFARHEAVKSAHRVDAPVDENGVPPVSFAEMFARHRAPDQASPAALATAESSREPLALADMLARQGGIEPNNTVDSLAAGDESEDTLWYSKTKRG